MLNNVIIMGRMTRDPELRSTNTGTSVAAFTLAVDRDRNNQDGTRTTDFIDCVAWKGTAEFVSKYFSKGSMAVVVGRLQVREWADKGGEKRRKVEVLATNTYFGESKARTESNAGRYDEDGNKYGSPMITDIDDSDGDLPF